MELLPGTGFQDEAAMAGVFMKVIPHARALGMELVEAGPGVVEIAMPWNPDLVGDPRTGVLHGGVISALMDTCCGAAVLTHPERPKVTATIDLRIDYLRSATPGRKFCTTTSACRASLRSRARPASVPASRHRPRLPAL